MTVRMFIFVGAMFGSQLTFSSAFADAFTDQQAALEVITKTAKDFCYQAEQQGSNSTVEISSEANVALNTVIAKLAELHIKGVGKYETEESKSVLQKDLAETIKSSINCTIDVFNTLVNKILGLKPLMSQNVINKIGNFLLQGQQMSNNFIDTGDYNTFITQYNYWSARVVTYLNKSFDRAYAAQFLSAEPIIVTQGTKTKFENAGPWQKLEGQNIFLNQLLTELLCG